MKMKDKIALIAAAAAEGPPLAAGPSDGPRHAVSGAVKAFGLTVTAAEQEAERLRGLITKGAQVLELDPGLIDRSPLADRMDDDDPAAIEALKASIAESGQEVPVLVRPHASAAGRYEMAYGHRRLAAVRALGRPIRAVVRAMSDAELAVAQGIENTARQDTSWIERARFAEAIEGAGHGREVSMRALGVDKAQVSRMLAVVRRLPPDIVAGIGRAPAVGWRRWQDLADRMIGPAERHAARDALAKAAGEGSDRRFAAVADAVAPAVARAAEPLIDDGGAPIGTLKRTTRTAVLTIDAAFGAWLASRIGELHGRFRAEDHEKE